MYCGVYAADRRRDAPGHAVRLPHASERAAGVGFELVARRWIRAVVTRKSRLTLVMPETS